MRNKIRKMINIDSLSLETLKAKRMAQKISPATCKRNDSFSFTRFWNAIARATPTVYHISCVCLWCNTRVRHMRHRHFVLSSNTTIVEPSMVKALETWIFGIVSLFSFSSSSCVFMFGIFTVQIRLTKFATKRLKCHKSFTLASL